MFFCNEIMGASEMCVKMYQILGIKLSNYV